jgi:chaperonin GroEL (HSP60 family)
MHVDAKHKGTVEGEGEYVGREGSTHRSCRSVDKKTFTPLPQNFLSKIYITCYRKCISESLKQKRKVLAHKVEESRDISQARCGAEAEDTIWVQLVG